MITKAFLVLLFTTLLPGCASDLPREIERAPKGAPSLDSVRIKPAAFAGKAVRWGGAIVSVDNQPGETRIEVVEKPLYRSGRPYEDDQSGGRFIAIVEEFLDPALFSKERLLTVFGEIDVAVTGKIGEYEYTYPVVRVVHYHLWAPIKRQEYPGYWKDPWYDPWHRPWRRPGYRSFHDPFFPLLKRHPSRLIRRL